MVCGCNPVAANCNVWFLTYGTTVVSITLLPTVFITASGAVLAPIPPRDLEVPISAVLLFALAVFPTFSTLFCGDSVTCLPVQFVPQSSYSEPKPVLPPDGLNVQLSFCPSKFVVMSGRLP